MFSQSQAHAASFERLRKTSFLRRFGKLASIPVLAAAAHGCAATPISPFPGPDPSDASLRVPAVSYRPAIGPFASQRPVEPGQWKKQAAQGPRPEHQ